MKWTLWTWWTNVMWDVEEVDNVRKDRIVHLFSYQTCSLFPPLHASNLILEKT
jgi:hypothetical protein